MKKKILIISTIITVIIAAIIGTQIYNNTRKKTNTEIVDPGVLEDPSSIAHKLNAIKTSDNIITIMPTTAYYSQEIKLSGMELEIKSQKSFEELYLLLTINIGDNKEEKPLYLTDVKKDEIKKYVVQSINDYSKINKWSVKKITKEEAIDKGLNFEI